jgi:LAO/AO transport system kinase
VPGLGDDVQSIKAGILEIADIFVVNKSDREGADRVVREIRTMQSLGNTDGWVPPVISTVASTGEGTAALAEAIDRCAAWLRQAGKLEDKRAAAWQERLLEMIRQRLTDELVHHRIGSSEMEAYAHAVAQHERDPYLLVEILVRDLLNLHRSEP